MPKEVKSDTTGRTWVHADKVNSRVTKAHIEKMNDAMVYAGNPEIDGYIRLGYLSFAIAEVLKDVGLPSHYEALSAKMWANFGKPAT